MGRGGRSSDQSARCRWSLLHTRSAEKVGNHTQMTRRMVSLQDPKALIRVACVSTSIIPRARTGPALRGIRHALTRAPRIAVAKPFAAEQLDAPTPGCCGAERAAHQPARARGGELAQFPLGSRQQADPPAGLGRKLDAARRRQIEPRAVGDHRRHAPASQSQIGRPQPVTRRPSADEQRPIQQRGPTGNRRLHQRGRIRPDRRADPDRSPRGRIKPGGLCGQPHQHRQRRAPCRATTPPRTRAGNRRWMVRGHRDPLVDAAPIQPMPRQNRINLKQPGGHNPATTGTTL